MDLIPYINTLLRQPAYRPWLAALKGARNGAIYGVKIRLPHATVMTFLFKGGPLKEKLKWILWATLTHAKNLAMFSALYKFQLALYCGSPRPNHPLVAGLAGAVCGWVVFGRYNKVTEQVNLYLLSRVTLALAKLVHRYFTSASIPLAGAPSLTAQRAAIPWFPISAAAVWAAVMMLFEYCPELLQASLWSSMDYIYHDPDHFSSVNDFLFHNKLE